MKYKKQITVRSRFLKPSMYKNHIQICYPGFKITNTIVIEDSKIELELINDSNGYVYKQVDMNTRTGRKIEMNDSVILDSYKDLET